MPGSCASGSGASAATTKPKDRKERASWDAQDKRRKKRVKEKRKEKGRGVEKSVRRREKNNGRPSAKAKDKVKERQKAKGKVKVKEEAKEQAKQIDEKHDNDHGKATDKEKKIENDDQEKGKLVIERERAKEKEKDKDKLKARERRKEKEVEKEKETAKENKHEADKDKPTRKEIEKDQVLEHEKRKEAEHGNGDGSDGNIRSGHVIKKTEGDTTKKRVNTKGRPKEPGTMQRKKRVKITAKGKEKDIAQAGNGGVLGRKTASKTSGKEKVPRNVKGTEKANIKLPESSNKVKGKKRQHGSNRCRVQWSSSSNSSGSSRSSCSTSRSPSWFKPRRGGRRRDRRSCSNSRSESSAGRSRSGRRTRAYDRRAAASDSRSRRRPRRSKSNSSSRSAKRHRRYKEPPYRERRASKPEAYERRRDGGRDRGDYYRDHRERNLGVGRRGEHEGRRQGEREGRTDNGNSRKIEEASVQHRADGANQAHNHGHVEEAEEDTTELERRWRERREREAEELADTKKEGAANLTQEEKDGTAEAAKSRQKAVVKCAAANDEEDLAGLSSTKAAVAAQPAVTEDGVEVAIVQINGKRREKEFAWMDSEDEANEEPDCNREPEDEEQAEQNQPQEKEEEVNADTLDLVQSFGRMMTLAPSLQKRLGSGTLGPADVLAACRALSRTKFFDADVLEGLCTELRKLLQNNLVDEVQVNDAIQCFKSLNAYNCGIFSVVAKAFKSKTRAMDAGIRSAWLDIFREFGHDSEKDFLQLLEVPALPATDPRYRKVRCWHHSRGSCALESLCTFSHDERAPVSLVDGGNEDWWRTKPLVMTQNQKTLGHGVYGLSGMTDLRAPPAAPAGWNVTHPPPGFVGAGIGAVSLGPGSVALPTT